MTADAQLHAQESAETGRGQHRRRHLASLDSSNAGVRHPAQSTQLSLAEVGGEPATPDVLAQAPTEHSTPSRPRVQQALSNGHPPMFVIGDYREINRRLSERQNEEVPEGDTIFRTATVLRAALAGRRITAARARPQPGLRGVPDLSRLVGASVASVEARGKHLLIGFDNGLTLRSHMRMKGSWHRYRPGERWRLPARLASAVLETSDAVAVAFSTPVLELLTDAGIARSRPLRELGPDLLGDDFDAAEALRRLRERDGEQLATALLDQRAVAGVGNVIKSETCFIERLDPWAPVRRFSDAELASALQTARRLLRANVGGGARVTTGSRVRGRSLWVYGRAGRPCRRCGTLIRAGRQGELARATSWCPTCQPAR